MYVYIVDLVHIPQMAEDRNMLNINLWTDTLSSEPVPTVHKDKYLVLQSLLNIMKTCP